jgi:hypothetical protein
MYEFESSEPVVTADRDVSPAEFAGHVAGVGFGGVCGLATGAVLGAVGGPIGMAIGAMSGGLAGAVAGEVIVDGLVEVFEVDQDRG